MKSKKILISSLLFSSIVAIPTIAIVSTSCSNSHTDTTNNNIIVYDSNKVGWSFDAFALTIARNQDKPVSNGEMLSIKKIVCEILSSHLNVKVLPESITKISLDDNGNVIIQTDKYGEFIIKSPYNTKPIPSKLIPNGLINLSNQIINAQQVNNINILSLASIINNVSYDLLLTPNVLDLLKEKINNYIDINLYKSYYSDKIMSDIKFYLKNEIINKFFVKYNINASDIGLFINVNNFSANPDNTINGKVYIQITNNTNFDLDINLNGPCKLNKNNTLSLELNFKNSLLTPIINPYDGSLFLGYKLSNFNVRYELNNDPIKTLNQTNEFEMLYSYELNTKVVGITDKNNYFSDIDLINDGLNNIIPSTSSDNSSVAYDIFSSINEKTQADFNLLKTNLQYSFELLEVLNDENLTIYDFLTSIGDKLYYLLRDVNINLAIIFGNLFSKNVPVFKDDNQAKNILPSDVQSNATTSGFFYNSFTAIINLLTSLRTDANAITIDSLISFINQQLGGRDFDYYKSFIKNISTLKTTVGHFLKNANILNPEQFGTVMALFDKIAVDDNIWQIIGDNIDLIVSLLSSIVGKSNSSLIPIFNALLQVINDIKNEGGGKFVDAKIWYFITSGNQHVKDLLFAIGNLLPNGVGTKIIDAILGILSNPKNNFSTSDILAVLTAILGKENPSSEEMKIAPKFSNQSIKRLSQYFATEFKLNIDPKNNITINQDKTISGSYKFNYVFNTGFTIDTQPLKHMLSTLPIFSGNKIKIANTDKITRLYDINNNFFHPIIRDNKLYWSFNSNITYEKPFGSPFNPTTLDKFFSFINPLLLSIIVKPIIINIITKPVNINFVSNILVSDKEFNSFNPNVINHNYYLNQVGYENNPNFSQLSTLIKGLDVKKDKTLNLNSNQYQEIINLAKDIFLVNIDNIPNDWYYGLKFVVQNSNNSISLIISSPINLYVETGDQANPYNFTSSISIPIK